LSSIFNSASTCELYCILNRPEWSTNIIFFVYITVNVFCDKFRIIFCLGTWVCVCACGCVRAWTHMCVCVCVSFLVFHYCTLSSKSWRVVMKSAKAPKLVSLPHEVNPSYPLFIYSLPSYYVRDVIKLLSVGQADNYISGTFGSWLIFHYIYDVICANILEFSLIHTKWVFSISVIKLYFMAFIFIYMYTYTIYTYTIIIIVNF